MFNAFLRRCNEPELLDRLSLFEGFVNRADHVEGLFRQLIAFAVNNHLEATDRFLERNVLTGRARKHFGHVEGLGQEALDLTSTRHGELVFRRQFVHTENCHVIMHQAMPLEEVKKVVHWCKERKLAFYLETNSGVYCNEQMIKDGPAVMIKYGQGKGADLSNATEKAKSFIDSFTLIHGDEFYREDVNKIDFIIRDYQDHLDAITAFPHLAHNTWGGKGELALFSDLGPTGINKKHAIEVLLDYLKLGKEDTISFGDAKVDLSMFECCGFNVAMGNGGKEIKEAADYITDDVNEDGLYNAFKYLKLI